jgi:hypothetical protein
MNSVVESLFITAMGAACATFCTLGRRSHWYLQKVIENSLRQQRRSATPDALAQMVRNAKTVLILGIAMGVAMVAMGVITLVIGVTTVLEG